MVYQVEVSAEGLRGGVRGYERSRVSSSSAVRPAFTATRVADVILSAGLILFISPLLLLICVLIKLQDNGPLLFSQQRKGLGGRSFRCFKFRSMVVDAEARLNAVLARDPRARAEWAADHKLRNDPRITALGRFLRKSSLDELPQLFNVLSGEMSLVGPRPIVEAEVEKYGRWYRHYCAVTPGITGMWQVSGRNDVEYRRRVALDVMFAKRRSLALYCRILLLTVPCLLLRDGAY